MKRRERTHNESETSTPFSHVSQCRSIEYRPFAYDAAFSNREFNMDARHVSVIDDYLVCECFRSLETYETRDDSIKKRLKPSI